MPSEKIDSYLSGGEYITADLYNPNAMVKMDITNIKYPDKAFDIIICNHVLEHIIDDKKAMEEFYRVIKDDGIALIMVPIIREKTEEDFSIDTAEGRLKAFGQEDHVRAYGKDFVERLRSVGFVVDVINHIDILSKKEIRKISYDGDKFSNEIYCCRK